MLPFCFKRFIDYACLVEQKQHFTTVLQNFDNITLTLVQRNDTSIPSFPEEAR